ncbi:MAG: AAA family ATPase [Pseudomonadales bacterium]|jgi:SpoVK/Ycf46/Vps4 family AAA+-type ATPase|nr:AAA family ATPase [Pseudomonadales bacterium]
MARRRRTRAFHGSEDALDQVAQLWALRILYTLGACRNVTLFCADAMLKWLGMQELIDASPSMAVFKKRCSARMQEIGAARPELPEEFRRNLRQLSRSIGLNPTEATLLGFAVVLHSHRGLDDVADELGMLTSPRVCSHLATLLRLEPAHVRAALSSDGLLRRSRLLSLESGGTLRHCLRLLDRLPSVLMEPGDGSRQLLAAYFHRTRAPGLGMRDFRHVRDDLDVLLAYLEEALARRKVGVNVLFYGPPGTGKTELSRALARRLRARAYEISNVDHDGDALAGYQRFNAYQLSQVALEKARRAIVVFDEIEDVFPDSRGQFGFTAESGRKAWVNRLLETNPTPAIWISNRIDQMDRAYLRRFDYVMHLDHPPREVRRRMLRTRLKDVPVGAAWVERLASQPTLSPALIAKAADVVATAGAGTERLNEQRLERVLGNTLRAMGRPLPETPRAETALPYSFDVLHADVDLEALVRGLQRRGAGRICLYGPPGTGKTAFGRCLAEVLDRPLLVRRASDLLRPFVGETEGRIAEMFERARADGALLLLDEADSFLRDREQSRQSWEVTQVNELLVQMEAFEGLFVCSTNLMDQLDRAALRRFDFKVRFDFLTPGQAWLLFERALANGGDVPDAEHWLKRLAALSNLTPGDFAVALRRMEVLGAELGAEGLFSELVREVEGKQVRTSRVCGFHADL